MSNLQKPLVNKSVFGVFSEKRPLSSIYFFSVIVLLIGMGDAIMAYVAPVYIEDHMNNTFLMGIVLSFSSVIGLICDFVFSELLRDKSYKFYMVFGFITALLFPLSFILLPSALVPFLLAMALWGIYYECVNFGDFHFIHTFTRKAYHADAWGILSNVRSIAYFIGPILATLLLSESNENNNAFYTALFFVSSALFAFLMFTKFSRYARNNSHVKANPVSDGPVPVRRSALVEAKIWLLLLKRIWPLYVFIFMLNILDAAFWTVGTVLSEDLKDVSSSAGFLLSAYMLPGLFLGFFAGKAARPFGKKRAAFISGILGGAFFAISGFITSVPLFVFVVFLASMALSLAWPEMSATIEDYIARLGAFGNDVIGLESSAVSISYIIGPILSGFVASIFGNQQTFSIIGFMLLIVSILSFFIVPRKIKMPVTALKQYDI